MHISQVVDDATGRQWIREQWRDPTWVESLLDEIQYAACSAIIKHPRLIKECTAHLFDSPGGFYLAVYRAVKAGANAPDAVFNELLGRGWALTCAEAIAALWWHPVTFLKGSAEISRLKKFIAWQYRQQKVAA